MYTYIANLYRLIDAYFIAWLGALVVTSLVTEEVREEQGCQLLTGGRVSDAAKISDLFVRTRLKSL
jgi:hypothetical protein